MFQNTNTFQLSFNVISRYLRSISSCNRREQYYDYMSFDTFVFLSKSFETKYDASRISLMSKYSRAVILNPTIPI